MRADARARGGRSHFLGALLLGRARLLLAAQLLLQVSLAHGLLSPRLLVVEPRALRALCTLLCIALHASDITWHRDDGNNDADDDGGDEGDQGDDDNDDGDDDDDHDVDEAGMAALEDSGE